MSGFDPYKVKRSVLAALRCEFKRGHLSQVKVEAGTREVPTCAGDTWSRHEATGEVTYTIVIQRPRT